MHLAYFDDSQQSNTLAMFGAVVIPHGSGFGYAEQLHSVAIEQLFQRDSIDGKFKEFHARDLFQGEGDFKGLPKDKRHNAIRLLLTAMLHSKLPFIYAAVDQQKLAKSTLSQSLFETADPLIPAFKLCALGVEEWAQSQHRKRVPGPGILVDYNDQYLLIIDETTDGALKSRLRNSYRLLRKARPYLDSFRKNRLWHSHDAMYFGNSYESVGIQLADLCTYFMQRRLLKRNPGAKDDGDEFFEMFAPLAICAKPEPEWSEYHELLRTHEGSPL